MNYLYLNNPPVSMATNRSFNFGRKTEKIDWRRIGKIEVNGREGRRSTLPFRLAALDVDRLARDLDFQVLQDNIEQIALCNIEAEVVRCSSSSPCVSQLFSSRSGPSGDRSEFSQIVQIVAIDHRIPSGSSRSVTHPICPF